MTVDTFKNVWEFGMTPDFAAEQVFEHVQKGLFYCILDNEFDGVPTGLDDAIKRRYDSFISRRFIPRSKVSGTSLLVAKNQEKLEPSRSRL
jgi:hypothetical protein